MNNIIMFQCDPCNYGNSFNPHRNFQYGYESNNSIIRGPPGPQGPPGEPGKSTKSPLLFKGDIWTFSMTDTRLAVGPVGSLLRANSSTATGLDYIGNINPFTANNFLGQFSGINIISGIRNTGYGTASLNAITTGSDNVAIGFATLELITNQNRNTSVGSGSLQVNSVDELCAFGYYSLHNNTTGIENSAFGFNSLLSNTIGNYNCAFGYHSLNNNQSGNYNTAFGNRTLENNTTTANSAFGYRALQSCTVGFLNVAFGNSALAANTTGVFNVSMGAGSMSLNVSGNNNVAIGGSSMILNTSGSDNSAVGSYALALNTLGSSNASLGNYALWGNKTGNENSAFGSMALMNNTTGNYNTAVGKNALFLNSSGNYNIGLGWESSPNLTTGNNNIVIGKNSGIALTTESNNIIISNNNNLGLVGVNNKTFIDNIYGVTTTNLGTSLLVYCDSNGNLGTTVSSAQFKNNIKNLSDDQNISKKLLSLNPVSFTYKEDNTNTLQFGLIAEEVFKVFPELVVLDKKSDINISEKNTNKTKKECKMNIKKLSECINTNITSENICECIEETDCQNDDYVMIREIDKTIEMKPYSVRYEQLTALLLNEVIKLRKEIDKIGNLN